MRLQHSQRGMTAIGWVLVLMLVGIIAMAGIRLLPVYLEARAVSSIMQGLTSDAAITEPREIRRSLVRRMEVNNIRAVKLDQFEIKNIDGRRHLVVDYEHRVPYIGNIDFLVSFSYQYEFRSQ